LEFAISSVLVAMNSLVYIIYWIFIWMSPIVECFVSRVKFKNLKVKLITKISLFQTRADIEVIDIVAPNRTETSIIDMRIRKIRVRGGSMVKGTVELLVDFSNDVEVDFRHATKPTRKLRLILSEQLRKDQF
jgi:hypothetical protein